MKKIKLLINGLGFRGERMQLKHKVEVPDFVVIPETYIEGLKRPWAEVSIQTQEDSYIDEHYDELIWKPAEAKNMALCNDYKRVVPKEKTDVYTLRRKNLQKEIGRLKKANDVLKLANQQGIKGQAGRDFVATMQVMWPTLQDLRSEQIVTIVQAAMVVGLQTAITSLKDALNQTTNELIEK